VLAREVGKRRHPVPIVLDRRGGRHDVLMESLPEMVRQRKRVTTE
jgi:hypothetical protein